MLIAFATTTTTPALSDGDLEGIADRQVLKFHNAGFSGEPSTPVPAIRHRAIGSWRHHPSSAAFGTVTKVTPWADCPLDRLAVNQSPAVATVSAVPAGCLISRLSNRHRGCAAAVTAITATRTVQIQALNTKRPTATATATGGAGDDNQAARRGPRPNERPGLDNPSQSKPRHTNTPPTQALARVTADLLHRTDMPAPGPSPCSTTSRIVGRNSITRTFGCRRRVKRDTHSRELRVDNWPVDALVYDKVRVPCSAIG